MNVTNEKHTAAGRRPKRQAILDATVALFRQAPDVRRVSIEDIAVEARVSPTTIYNQFGSRDALITEAAKSLITRIGLMAEEFIHSDLPFDQKLRGVVSGKISISSAASDEVIAKLLSQDKNIAPYIEKLFHEVAWPMWRNFLTEGKSQGFVDPGLDVEIFLTYLDIIRAGFSAHKDLLVEWRQNMDKLEKLTNIAFYGFLKKDIDLFGKKECK